MPIADESTYTFRYVNVHPRNTGEGLQSVMAWAC
jgi:ornithine cyclodeaminase